MEDHVLCAMSTYDVLIINLKFLRPWRHGGFQTIENDMTLPPTVISLFLQLINRTNKNYF